ncbi:MAG: phosphatase PAP2 family protein [Deltaproteobacteria bacterium]|nr:phosphatase PAP2 family protein [Deltaproteobacteria bacterium]
MPSKKPPRWQELWRRAQHPACVAAVAFVVAVVSLSLGVDRPTTDAFHEYMRPYDPLLQILTILGDGRFLIPACLVVAAARAALARARASRQRAAKLPLLALGSLLASGILTQLLKISIGRPRPYTEGDTRYSSADLNIFHWFTTNKDFSSFPSGHSTAVFAVAWFAILNTKSRGAQVAFFAGACVVALTRVALWKHYFADTLAGAAIGIAVSELVAAAAGLSPRPATLSGPRPRTVLK